MFKINVKICLILFIIIETIWSKGLTTYGTLDEGGDTRGYSVSQTFSTIDSQAEPGQPCPCGPCTSAFSVVWYTFTLPAPYVLIETTGPVGLSLGVYSGSGASFSTLVLAGAAKVTVAGQTASVQTSGTVGEMLFIMVGANIGLSNIKLNIQCNTLQSNLNLPTNMAPSCIATPPPPPQQSTTTTTTTPPPTPPPPSSSSPNSQPNGNSPH